MCGIAGIVKFTHAESAPWATPASGRETAADPSLHKMAACLSHRGPDGEGIWTDPRPTHTVALVHRRLSIIDHAGGAQPMPNETRDVWVVFNGEIYNHAILRKELQAVGHTFASDHSDTEVLLHGWEQWGTDLPSHLLGMFAFALWDFRPTADGQPADTLFLARDRLGQKPLFYATLEDGIVFGSTVRAIQAWPEVPRRVPVEQIGLYLLLGYFPAPQTVWRDISQVLPGAWVRIRKDVVDGGVYWQRADAPEKIKSAPELELRPRLERAVASQMMADVPVACFLSGGIDSSIIASLMQATHTRAGGGPIQTVSVGFAESAFDETPFAEAVAKKIGSHHTRLEVAPDHDVVAQLTMLMQTGLGMPFADSSILPTYQLSKAVRELASVALSGDGADELFGGYDRYRALTILTSSPAFLAKFMPKSLPVGSLAKQEKYRRLAAAARAKGIWGKYTRLSEIFPLDLAEELLGQPIMDYIPLPEEYHLDDDVSALRYAMSRDQQEYLPGDVLWKVDTASMAVGLEVRSPFLDHQVVEFANRLDDKEHTYRGIGKVLLRNTFANDLPPVVQGRGKKGFAIPIGEWFKTSLKNSLTDLLFASDSFAATHLKVEVVRRLVDEHMNGTRDHTHRLFALFTLELWYRNFAPMMEADPA